MRHELLASWTSSRQRDVREILVGCRVASFSFSLGFEGQKLPGSPWLFSINPKYCPTTRWGGRGVEGKPLLWQEGGPLRQSRMVTRSPSSALLSFCGGRVQNRKRSRVPTCSNRSNLEDGAVRKSGRSRPSRLYGSGHRCQVEQKGHWENRMMNVIRNNRIKGKARRSFPRKVASWPGLMIRK